jgi:hypothetical protein
MYVDGANHQVLSEPFELFKINPDGFRLTLEQKRWLYNTATINHV